ESSTLVVLEMPAHHSMYPRPSRAYRQDSVGNRSEAHRPTRERHLCALSIGVRRRLRLGGGRQGHYARAHLVAATGEARDLLDPARHFRAADRTFGIGYIERRPHRGGKLAWEISAHHQEGLDAGGSLAPRQHFPEKKSGRSHICFLARSGTRRGGSHRRITG